MDMNPKRRDFLKFAGLGAASLTFSGCAVWRSIQGDTNASRPNIVLVMADDQGWGDTGYNGHERLKTPILDEMASLSLRFDRFYSAAPVCSPTRGSVMTGRHPNRYGCFSWGYTLRPQEVTIAEVLKTIGYRTGHFGKWHLGPVRAESPVSPGNSGFDEWFSSPNFYENSPLMSHNGNVVETEGEGSLVTVEAALKFIRDAAGSEQPFLAVVWFGSPHLPYVALPEYRERYKDLPTNLQNYYGEITAMDQAVGLLRHELRTLGIAENTLFWYTSDNGATGAGSTGGLSGKKGSLWEGGLRVPAIIEWPARIKSPVQSSIPCCTVDIYPTLLDIVGAKVERQPKPLDGISLLPLIKGSMKSRSKPLGFWVYPERGQGVKSAQILEELAKEQAGGAPSTVSEDDPGKITRQYPEDELPGHAAWLDNDYKLHRIPDKKGQVSYQLFNLAKDPQEKKDLAALETKRTGRMKAELETWQKTVIQSLNGGDYYL